MIITRLFGGLGNQMFQYAAGYACARRAGCSLKLDVYDLVDRTPRTDFIYRDYDLGIFRLQPDFASRSDLRKVGIGVRPEERHLWERVRGRLGGNRRLVEKGWGYNAAWEGAKPPVHLLGYWQNERYFADVADGLREEFAFRADYASDDDAVARRIRGTEAVCVNVRRGDFVALDAERERRGFCDAEYFRRAVEEMRSLVPGAEFFGFSDEVEWCRENIRAAVPIQWVGHEHAGIKFGKYLWLMSQCRHFIIPNSTFAWWGAWLGEKPDTRVIAPLEWFADERNAEMGIVPARWTRV